MTCEVGQPIQNSPFAAPSRHWYSQRGRDPQIVERRRAAFRDDSSALRLLVTTPR